MGSGSLPGHPEMGGPVIQGRMRSGYSEPLRSPYSDVLTSGWPRRFVGAEVGMASQRAAVLTALDPKECPPPGTSSHARCCACRSSAQWPPPHWRARRSASTHAGYWQAETAATSGKTTMMILVIGAGFQCTKTWATLGKKRNRTQACRATSGAMVLTSTRNFLPPAHGSLEWTGGGIKRISPATAGSMSP